MQAPGGVDDQVPPVRREARRLQHELVALEQDATGVVDDVVQPHDAALTRQERTAERWNEPH